MINGICEKCTEKKLKNFFTLFAIEENVTAFTQNEALSAILFPLNHLPGNVTAITPLVL
jgi:hypothetical protein